MHRESANVAAGMRQRRNFQKVEISKVTLLMHEIYHRRWQIGVALNSQGRTNEDWDAERDLIWRKKFPKSESKDLNLNVGHREGFR